jgi:hypothetical protein
VAETWAARWAADWAAASRAGHWKHEWIPLDYTAAKEKGHGHAPKGWVNMGKPRAPEPQHGGGWHPHESQTHLDIEQVGTGGTASGAFHRTRDVARMERDGEGTWHVRTREGHKLGEVRPSIDRPGWWAAHGVDEVHGTRGPLAYHGNDFMAATSSVLGHPGYGYSWYRVKREGGSIPQSRPKARRG